MINRNQINLKSLLCAFLSLQKQNKKNFSTCKTPLNQNDSLRVVFFGSDLLSAKILSSLCKVLNHSNKKISELCVITSSKQLHNSNDSHVKNNTELVSELKGNKIINMCDKNKIKYYLWPDVSKPEQYKSLFSSYSVGVVASFGHLIPSDLIELFP
jgi:methionyl-tRNA formyltransferase